MSSDEREWLFDQTYGGGFADTARGVRALEISERQFKCRVWRRKLNGNAVQASPQRGKVSNNRLADGDRVRILNLLRERYPNFGSTPVAEKVLERKGIEVSREASNQCQPTASHRQ